MSKGTVYMLKALYVLSWIIFVGLGIEAGGLITHTVATLLLSPEGAAKFWKEIDLTTVYEYDQSRYVTLSSLLIIATVLKAVMFYTIIRILHTKEFDLSKPFNEALKRFVLILSYLAIGIGLFSAWAHKLIRQLLTEGLEWPNVLQLPLGGADVWLFMGVILLVVAFIFKKGIEIQNENDLTV